MSVHSKDELRRLAEAAEQAIALGETSARFAGDVWAFRAAANPATVLGLLDEIAEMRGELQRVDLALGNRSAFDGFGTRYDKICCAVSVAARAEEAESRALGLIARSEQAEAEAQRIAEHADHNDKACKKAEAERDALKAELVTAREKALEEAAQAVESQRLGWAWSASTRASVARVIRALATKGK